MTGWDCVKKRERFVQNVIPVRAGKCGNLYADCKSYLHNRLRKYLCVKEVRIDILELHRAG